MIKGHGDDIYEYKQPIKSNFSSNVFYGADLSGLNAHLCKCMSSISNYPEPEPYTLEHKLAMFHCIPAESVCVTNGATEAIYLIAQTFRETNSAIFVPTFSEYADACRIHSHQVTSIYTPEHLPENIRMAWICNPNNPTGSVWDKTQLSTYIQSHPQVCFVIDQAYEYFTEDDLFSAEEAWLFPNVIQLHSMTKRYAIPGLRLGYITAPAGLIQRIRAHRMPWSVNQLAIEAGLYLLNQDITYNIELQDYLTEAKKLKSALESTGAIEVWPTDTHYMLARLRFGKARALKDFLANEYGFLIRDASNFEGLNDDFFRVASQSSGENQKLVEYINEWLAL
ncbi:threonine-phosphate decarboxylase [Bacteroides sp. 51]|uniref:threonine-phosphate decarboxylase n=1 Tax=Bacteroides sp. 51 TaxID=2302938 RepID=UPI0013D07367|nr:threonine-phosphate decarboxylase [Bacteroides sp. 51]NDV82008.1 pyridoxal phosphate-dependent class II aminotransferase [Bacteroides sp. 51]